MLDYGTTWGANPDAKLLKISYLRGNLPPVVEIQQSLASGREPLSVKFTSNGTRKREGGNLTYAWRLKTDGPVVSKEADFSATFDKPGTAVVELTVTDAFGASTKKTASVVVGNSVPEVRFESPVSGDFFTPGKPVAYKIAVKDFEDGESKTQAEGMGPRVVLESRWLKSADEKTNVDPGLALAKQSDCFNCHQVEQRLVGPSYLEVAERYKGVTGALEASVLRVRNGSSGVWGPIPMLAHQQHTSDEIAQMVSWIFALERGKTGGTGGQRGLTGEASAPKDNNLRIGFLEASYTDNGRGEAPPLTGKTRVELRARRIEAENTDTLGGCKPLGSNAASGKKCLGSIADGSSAIFKNIPLHQVGGFTCRVSSGGEGGKIELRAGAANGPLLGSFDVQPTGGWETWVELKAPLQAIPNTPERADVFVVFSNPGKSGLMNFDWLQFESR
jgi:cytochrome c